MTSPLESWREEKESSFLYRVVAGIEPDPPKATLFAKLADKADEQAETWAAKAAEAGHPVPDQHEPSRRATIVAAIVRRIGPRAARGILAAMKVRGVSVYDGHGLRAGHAMPSTVSEVGGRHASAASGGNLRAAVFGVNDGLVSNTSLILGVAGAQADPGMIVLSGVAGMLAGAFSMAAGEYISVRTQREFFEYQIGLERAEFEEYPEEEQEEIALIYEARGLPLEEARETAARLMSNPEHALDTLAREELGLNPDDLGSPRGAALSSFLAFALGACLPLLPFLLIPGSAALPTTLGLAAAGLFAVGATISLFTGRSALTSGLRLVAIGAAAGLVTWLIGSLL